MSFAKFSTRTEQGRTKSSNGKVWSGSRGLKFEGYTEDGQKKYEIDDVPMLGNTTLRGCCRHQLKSTTSYGVVVRSTNKGVVPNPNYSTSVKIRLAYGV
jgi:hypothetical protein